MTRCTHEKTELRRRRTITGMQFRHQCLVDGKAVGPVVPLKRVEHPASVPRWDVQLEERHKEAKPNSKRIAYQKHLRSHYWRALKQRRLELAGYRCEQPGCENDERLELHHKHYLRFGHERITDVEILCQAHHRAESEGRFFA